MDNKGPVALGVSTETIRVILKARRLSEPPFASGESEQDSVWL